MTISVDSLCSCDVFMFFIRCSSTSYKMDMVQFNDLCQSICGFAFLLVGLLYYIIIIVCNVNDNVSYTSTFEFDYR